MKIHASDSKFAMKIIKCPICKKTFQKMDDSPLPFCSERCKISDLGAWLDGQYKISNPVNESMKLDESGAENFNCD
tara:strand:+ start:2227 stop:2454 length:228 start_codon:yes stop_codon:yes gene_type:complete